MGDKKKMMVASSDDEDSDVEKNFALLTSREGESGRIEDGDHSAEEEEEDHDEEDGDLEESESGEEEEEDGVDEGGVSKSLEEDLSDDDENSDEDDDEDCDEGGSSQIQTKEDLRKEMSTMSFEEILKLQNKVGTKVFNEVAFDSSRSPRSSKKKRLNKNRPMEISAKKPAPFLRQVVPIKKPVVRDPRFDDLSGEYKPEIYEQTYKFISDIKQREKEIIQKKLKKTKRNGQKEKLQFLLKRLENQERARETREKQRERELQFKREQRARADQGARPFFLKKSDKKKLQLAEKYQDLKKSGKLEKFLSKKRKRNAGKDRRKLPKDLQGKTAS
ncbi:ribosomal RNA processing protein 36 homolog [Oryzias melastigma]|uniref:rRNA biogenesis protein RRP36 n=1 Tax=Oryzias melastigma TaxID=30732 RepID=A0A3B3BQW8_ORYME|nr:ribosomal RNA processing protein 36 homolog [Oryzias melastigma]XP_024145026.1 ribosomal RNA processing protein 36 homolog [Oryzias melastigma]